MKVKFLFSVGLLSAAFIGFAGSEEAFKQQVAAATPQVKEFRQCGDAAWEMLDGNGGGVGVLYLENIDDSDRKMGFGGTIEVALVTDGDGKIAGVLIGKNNETPRFLELVESEGFLRRWNGMTLKQAAAADVEFVTGATYSSGAIAHGVKNLAAALSGEKPAGSTQADVEALTAEAVQLERKIAMSSYILARSTILMDQRLNRRDEELRLREVIVLEGREAAEKFAEEHNLALSAHSFGGEPDTPLGKAAAKYKSSGKEADLKEVRRLLEEELDAGLKTILPHNVEHAKSILATRERLSQINRKLGKESPADTPPGRRPPAAK